MSNTLPTQRLKLLYLMKIFFEKTDDENALTTNELIEELAAYGISAERKTIYSDIELLRIYGIDIECRQTKTFQYYVPSRTFELPELKLLVDAVQSSRFITEKKSLELIKKIYTLTSAHQAKQLHRHVHVTERPKTINESIYYNIDAIHAAINENKKINFKYFDYSTDKKKVYRKDGGTYTQTPVSLCWNDDSYYLITYNSKYDGLVHYRIDRISHVDVSDQDADFIDRKRFNVAEHCKKVFGMYSGEIIKARLSFDNSLVNVVLDRFGKNIGIIKDGDQFQILVDISDSPVFLAWMFQFGKQAAILEPQPLKDSMKKMLEENTQIYS